MSDKRIVSWPYHEAMSGSGKGGTGLRRRAAWAPCGLEVCQRDALPVPATPPRPTAPLPRPSQPCRAIQPNLQIAPQITPPARAAGLGPQAHLRRRRRWTSPQSAATASAPRPGLPRPRPVLQAHLHPTTPCSDNAAAGLLHGIPHWLEGMRPRLICRTRKWAPTLPLLPL